MAGATLALMLAGAGVASAGVAAPSRFADCAQAEQAGQVNIPRGSVFYADRDGVACEAKGRGPDTDEVVAGSSDDTGLDADEYEDDDDYPGHEHEHDDHDDHDDQVSVLPEGGAATGDGSTDGATGWWISGGLLAALAAAGLASRRRVARLAGR